MSGDNNISKRSMTLTIITIISALIGIGGFLTEPAPQLNERFYFKNSGGAVMFNHQQHIENTESCADCHHEVLFADQRALCSDCHDNEVNPADFTHSEFMDIDSHVCTTCHLTDENKEPQSCTSCHPGAQEAEQVNIPCMQCHDDDEYNINLLIHDEMQEIEEHSCKGCHNTKVVSDAFHKNCTRCHLIENEDKFLTAENKVRCVMCHLK